MRPEDWERAEQWFHRLAPLEPTTRAALFAEVSAESPDLGLEVESLLAAHDSQGLLDRLAERIGPLPADPSPAESLEGASVAHYEVAELVGRGGMGAVYRARDTRLGRDVALKFLPDWLSRDPGARDRFLVEARIVSSIDHPNVCALLEMGETDDGRSYLIMPYYAGETLKRRLARGSLPVDEALRVALQAARGLAAAHGRGIVHRDIKPANLLLTDGGSVKILDFGVAKLADVELTRTGETPGTIVYMSPEQAAGRAVDARTDLWSLGVVLYEMLTGERPAAPGRDAFDSDAVGTGSRIPREVADVLSRLLARDPEDRYEDAAALAEHLATVATGSVTRSVILGATVAQPPSRRWPIGVAGLIGGLLLAAGGWLTLGAGSADDDAPVSALNRVAAPAVAVLPFRVVGDDLGYLREGAVDLMSMNFDGAPGLRKIDAYSAMTLWNERIGQQRAAPTAAVDVARELGATYAVLGSAVRVGSNRVRLAAEAYDVSGSTSRGMAHVEGSPDSLAGLMDGLTVELLRRGIVPADSSYASSNLARITTASLPALKAFLAGESAYRRGSWPEAAAQYRAAIEHDEAFARAHYRLGWSLFWGNVEGASDEHFLRAAELATGLPERDSLLLTAKVRPPDESFAMLERLTSVYPDDPDGWFLLGDNLFHAGGLYFRPESDYTAALRRAAELAPHYQETTLHLFEDAFYRFDPDRVDSLVELTTSGGPGSSVCPGFALLRDMRWGGEVVQRRAAAMFDSIYPALDSCVWTAVAAVPAALEIAEQAELPLIETNVPGAAAIPFAWRLIQARISSGHLAAARDLAERAGRNEDLRNAAILYTATLYAPPFMTEPAETPMVVDRLRSASRSARFPFYNEFWIAVLALETDRPEEFATAVAAIDSIATAMASDSVAAALAGAHKRVLDSYRALKVGDLGRLESFERAMAGVSPYGWISDMPSQYLRLEVGRILLDARRLEDAERYFRSLYPYSWHYVPAQYYLGRVYEAMGDLERAQARYRIFAEWWRTADSELQPWVEAARASLTR